MKGFSYVVLSKYPSGFTQKGGPASAAIAGQSGKMLQMQLLEMNNNINAIKEGAEQPFFLVSDLMNDDKNASGTVSSGDGPKKQDPSQSKGPVSSGSKASSFQYKGTTYTFYQVDFGGSGGGQSGGGVMQAGFGADEHWIGPALIGLGQPFNYLKPVGALGSSPGSSIASKTLSKVIPYSSPFIKKSTTFLFGRSSSTAVLGRALGRFVPVLGWGLTTYDLWDNREKINEFIQEQRKTNETHKDDLIWHVR